MVFEGKPSQSFVCRLSYSWFLFKSLFRTLEDERKNVVDCSVQSSAKEFYYSAYSFILLIRVMIWVKESHSKRRVIEKYKSPMLCKSSGMWVKSRTCTLLGSSDFGLLKLRLSTIALIVWSRNSSPLFEGEILFQHKPQPPLFGGFFYITTEKAVSPLLEGFLFYFSSFFV